MLIIFSLNKLFFFIVCVLHSFHNPGHKVVQIMSIGNIVYTVAASEGGMKESK